MQKFMVLGVAILAASLATTTAFAGATLPLWSDLEDVTRYRSELVPDASVILEALATQPEIFIPDAASDGAQIIGTIALEAEPTISGDSETYGDVVAFMRSKTKGYFFRRYSISVSGTVNGQGTGDARQVRNVKILEDVALSELHFQINAGLISRMILLEDPDRDISVLYPLGVGGLDPGLISPGGTSLMTPIFRGATLHRKTVVSRRANPAYYRGMPFMPITTARGVLTPIAFHITILSDGDWKTKGSDFLVRGFDSHGCMRLRQKDLTEYFTIVMNGGSDALPVNVDYFIFNRSNPSLSGRDPGNGLLEVDHPYPLNEAFYQRVKNFAAKGETPRYERDPKENLPIMEKVTGVPDLTHLKEFSADDLADLKIFDGLVGPEGSPPDLN